MYRPLTVYGPTHEVQILCRCATIESCEVERYVSDIRILHDELEAIRAQLATRAEEAGQQG